MITRPPFARTGVALVAVALGALLLGLSSRYGPHRDELYFAAAGRRLAWGYPDQPSLVALLARISEAVAGHSLVMLRVPSILAVCGTVGLAAALARVLGAERRSQVVSAAVTASAAVIVFLGHRLTTQTFSVLAWTAIALVAAHALTEDRPRLWLLAGLVAGVGLNAKNDVVVCLLGLGVGVLSTPSVRHHLGSVWWWAGGLLAALMWLPNLTWQATHGWPVFELSAGIRAENGGAGGALAYVLQALLIFSPVMSVAWLVGARALLRREQWRPVRPLGWILVVTFVFFLLTGGKAYYLSGAIVPALVAGCVVLAQRLRRLVAAGLVTVLSAAVAWPAGLPVLPASAYAGSFYPGIDDDQLETIGWPQFVNTVRGAVRSLPRGAVVFTGNYGEAGALEWYGVGVPVYSGHNGWGYWGPPPDGAGPVVVVGYRDRSPTVDFTGCTVSGTIPTVDGADNQEAGGRVWTCAAPRQAWSQIWARLVHLDA